MKRVADAADVADRIHSAAIRLLRYVRKEDAAAGVSAAQLSVLSVLVFHGPQSLTQLAAAEQVRLPTMSRLISELERRELVGRKLVTSDRRVSHIAATKKGRALLEEGRRRRLTRLVAALVRLPPARLLEIASAADAIVEATSAD